MAQECIFIKDVRPGLKNINVVFIILEVGPVTLTKENREVRSFKVGDPSACINVSIWDEPGKLLVPGDIVKMTKGYSSIWRNCLTLYSGKSGEIIKVGDFCMVFNEQLNMSEPNSPLIAQASAAPTPVMNNGNPNNGSGLPQQGPEASIGTLPVSTVATTITAPPVPNTGKGHRYAGGDAPSVNTKASGGSGKTQSQRSGRGSKNTTPKNERR